MTCAKKCFSDVKAFFSFPSTTIIQAEHHKCGIYVGCILKAALGNVVEAPISSADLRSPHQRYQGQVDTLSIGGAWCWEARKNRGRVRGL